MVSEFQAFEIPLKYSTTVDHNDQHLLSYGHINIYTPSLFKFLLKTEGFKILSEKLTNNSEEVIRFMWEKDVSLGTSVFRNLKLTISPAVKAFKKIFRGNRLNEEYGFSAFTCLAVGRGKLKIFLKSEK